MSTEAQATVRPWKTLAWKLGRRVPRRLWAPVARRRSLAACTFGEPVPGALRCRLRAEDLAQVPVDPVRVAALAERARAHRFDLLGSGLVEVAHGIGCSGLEGHRYGPHPEVRADPDGRWLQRRLPAAALDEAMRVWSLVDEGYRPIDWQLDFRSGWRWSEATWHRDVRIAPATGADVKVPWELSRMQHLPALAHAFRLARGGSAMPAPADAYAREFRNQVLDWIAANPPQFGVNWACTMDVGIRAAGWALSYDLLSAAGARFDDAFCRELARSLRQHGRHIVANLEWAPVDRGNHYLANVAGLLFVAAYLPPSGETERWMRFARRELETEVRYQFHPDGSNFEGSTCYHGLSAEMVAWATALVLGERGGDPASGFSFSDAYSARVEGMARFLTDVAAPNGLLPQVGDNDSGRFFGLAMAGGADGPPRKAPPPADTRDFRGTASALRALLGDPAVDQGPEAALAMALAAGRTLSADTRDAAPDRAGDPAMLGDAGAWARAQRSAAAAERPCIHRFAAPGPDLRDGLRPACYPGIGLWVLRSPRLYLVVRCGAVGQNGRGGHAHNDQLSLELWIDGVPRVTDPGTYVYTPLPERRNAYRSVHAHFAPRVRGREPASLARGLFRLADETQARCTSFGPEGFSGMHRGYGGPVWRVVAIESEAVVVTDFFTGAAQHAAPVLDCEADGMAAVPPSPAYGVIDR